MIYLFNIVIAICAWLGIFRIDLVPAFLSRPFGEVLATLTAVDYLLLAVSFIIVSGLMELLDRYTNKKQRSKS
jgi:hypothetical protein